MRCRDESPERLMGAAFIDTSDACLLLTRAVLADEPYVAT